MGQPNASGLHIPVFDLAGRLRKALRDAGMTVDAKRHHLTAEDAAARVGTRDAYRFAAQAAGHVGRAAAAYRGAAEAAGRQEFNRSADPREMRTWGELDALEQNQWIATAAATTPRWAQ